MINSKQKKIIFISFNKVGWECLEKIIKSKLVDISCVYTLKSELACKISDYEDPAALCQKHGVLLKHIKNINDHLQEIRNLEPDFIFVIGWSQLLSEELLKTPRFGCIGFHPALLPKNRGRAAIPWHFINEEKFGGVTFFYLDGGCDSGNIICQGKFLLTDNDNAKTYYEKVVGISGHLIGKNLKKIISGKLRGVKQNESKATYLMIRNETDSFLDFKSMTTRAIFNQIRGVAYVYPTAFAFYEKKKIFIYHASQVAKKLQRYSAVPGQVIKAFENSIWVKTTDGIIELEKIYNEKNEPIVYSDFFKTGHYLNR
jgi:methionyl-tRNA formyltransferase